MTSQPGDMTVLSLALSYEEVRAFILGLTQSTPPQSTTKTQIYNAASGLVQALAYMGSTKPLTIAEYATIWLMLFQGTPAGGGPLDRPCRSARTDGAAAGRDLLHPPQRSRRSGSRRFPPIPYEHQNTDRASKWRIVVTGTLPRHATRSPRSKFGTIFTRTTSPSSRRSASAMDASG